MVQLDRKLFSSCRLLVVIIPISVIPIFVLLSQFLGSLGNGVQRVKIIIIIIITINNAVALEALTAVCDVSTPISSLSERLAITTALTVPREKDFVCLSPCWIITNRCLNGVGELPVRQVNYP